MAYSMDLRQRVIDDCDAGLGTKAVALRYHVSPAWARRLKQHRRERGNIVPRTGTGRPPIIDDHELAELVQDQPDATIKELHQRLGCACSESALCMALQQLRLTFKKSPCTRPSRSGPTSQNAAPRGKPVRRRPGG